MKRGGGANKASGGGGQRGMNILGVSLQRDLQPRGVGKRYVVQGIRRVFSWG